MRTASPGFPLVPISAREQLVRVAMAATGAGLARLMQGRRAEAAGWFARSAERFRESYADAPVGSWGRLIGAVKARVLAGDWDGAVADAEWALDQAPAEAESPIGRYAAVLALLVLGRDEEATRDRGNAAARGRCPPSRTGRGRPGRTGVRQRRRLPGGRRRVLVSFEERDAYLEDIPVADTVVVLEALAGRRRLAAGLTSPLLPDG